MSIKRKKGFKPFLFKSLALLIGVCYLANPVQSQIGVVFHEISHMFDAHDNLLTIHSTNSVNLKADHHYHQHNHIDETHEHEFIDFFTLLFETAGEDSSSEDSLLTDIKYDKHTKTESYDSEVSIFTPLQLKSMHSANSLRKGFLRSYKKPPKKPFFRCT